MILIAMVVYTARPELYKTVTPEVDNAAGVPPSDAEPSPQDTQFGPIVTELQGEILAALKVTDWPRLDPSMEDAIKGDIAAPDIKLCGLAIAHDESDCTWGPDTASTRAVLVGDSIAMSYAGPLRRIAEDSAGRLQVRSEAMYGCQFVDDDIATTDEAVSGACPARKQQVVDLIDQTKPNLVVISNVYDDNKTDKSGRRLSFSDWGDVLGRMLEKIRGSGAKIVLLSAPPPDKKLSECFGKRSSKPADCISVVTSAWRSVAETERKAAAAVGGLWIDSRPWFCSGRQCPSFVGATPTKRDWAHMTPQYGEKIYRAIDESLKQAGAYQ